MAITYSSTCYGSTIGATGLNFSVRNGKRCTPALSSPLISLHTMSKVGTLRCSVGSCRAISTARLCHLWPYTCGLSTSSSLTALIWKPHLGAGFALRCFQCLSLPYIATLRCGWRHNRYTRGTSNPVLSY